jgi:hypothetical protein
VALLVVVAAPVGAAPGTMQLVWHDAACALQSIMQLVTVDVWANRSFPAAASVGPQANPHRAATAHAIAKRCIDLSPQP